MTEHSAIELNELATDIEGELAHLRQLAGEVQRVAAEVQADQGHANLFRENLALKLHNFYTGCERIFQIVGSELNGVVPTGYDWHKRLLERMAQAREDRPGVISAETARALNQYLAFRHVVRNLYGFQLEADRVDQLVARYPEVWKRVETDVLAFVGWLRALAAELSQE